MKQTRISFGVVVVAVVLLACIGGVSAQSAGERIWEQGEISEPTAVYETNDTVYIVDDVNTLFAVDTETGGIKWRRSLPSVNSNPTELVVGEDYVYVAIQDRSISNDEMVAFDKSGNGLVWSTEFDERDLEDSKIKLTEDGLLLYDTNQYNLLNFNKDTGEVTESSTVDYTIGGEPEKVVLTSDYIAVGNDSSVSIIEVSSGEIIWAQRYGTVGAVAGGEELYVVAGSDPANDEFTSHMISYDISSQQRTNSADFRYASTKAKIVHSDEVVLIRNRDDDRVIGYNMTTGELAYDVNQDTYDYSIGTSKDYFIAGSSFRDIKTGEQVATVDESIRFPGFRTPVGLTNRTAIVWGSTSNYQGEDTLIGVKSPSGTESPVPTDPTERALQITGKEDPSELTQDDVTVVITRFNRGQSVDNIEIKQDDVTATITLFERN